MVLFSSNRTFRPWLYTVSHSQLLIRSPKEDIKGLVENVDLVFSSVFYMELAEYLYGIEIETATAHDLDYLKTKVSITEDDKHKFYILKSQDKRYYVGAYSIRTSVNTLSSREAGF